MHRSSPSIPPFFLLSLALGLLPLAAGAVEAPQGSADPYRYDIDPGHSSAGFSARHFMVSNVRGKLGVSAKNNSASDVY